MKFTNKAGYLRKLIRIITKVVTKVVWKTTSARPVVQKPDARISTRSCVLIRRKNESWETSQRKDDTQPRFRRQNSPAHTSWKRWSSWNRSIRTPAGTHECRSPDNVLERDKARNEIHLYSQNINSSIVEYTYWEKHRNPAALHDCLKNMERKIS